MALNSRPLPLVGLTTCKRGGHEGRPELDDHVVGDKYVSAIGDYSGVVPVPIISAAHTNSLVPILSGIVLTGSLSNVHPQRYGRPDNPSALPHAPERDALTWALLDHAIQRQMPILAICRGIQELNAYFGGTLHARVHETPGLSDHRAAPTAIERGDINAMYGPNHSVEIASHGVLKDICAGEQTMLVNSLHWQGIDELARALRVEATASQDRLVEAVSIQDYAGFSLGVQWHPEFDASWNPHSKAIFQAFGRAVAKFHESKNL